MNRAAEPMNTQSTVPAIPCGRIGATPHVVDARHQFTQTNAERPGDHGLRAARVRRSVSCLLAWTLSVLDDT
jgi:hypothetical protein